MVLYFYPHPSTFIAKDIGLLQRSYTVRHFTFNPSHKLLLGVSFLRQFFQLAVYGFSADIIICRFAAYHSLFPLLFARLLRKPSLLIIGGTEAHYFPSIGYGSYTKKVYGWVTRASLRLAGHIAPVDESLVYSNYTYDEGAPAGQGYKSFSKKIDTPYTVVYNGYDPSKFFFNEEERREPGSFVTVAQTIDGAEFQRKGIDLILGISGFFPDSTFTIIGHSSQPIDRTQYPNVIQTGSIPNAQLVEKYHRAEYYLQLSMAEGFPNALCEAMLCGCIPIGSDVFGIPKIIGEAGFVLKKKDIPMLKSLVEAALKADKKALALAAREQIVLNFSLARREKELLNLVQKLMDRKMNIVVTGGAGFIGSNLCESLLQENHRVVCIDNFDNFYDPAIKRDNVKALQSAPGFILEEGDIRDANFLKDVFERHPADLVIHLAARAGVRPSIANPTLYFDVNINGTLCLLEAMKDKGIKNMVFASSSSVYGNNSKVPFSEADSVDKPISPYAASKKACELLLYTYHHLFDFNVFCLRFFTVYGPKQRPEMAIHYFTDRIIGGLPIPVFGDGSSERDYTYIGDIVQGIMGAIRNLKGYEIINLGESSTISLSRLVSVIENYSGSKALIDRKPVQAGDVNRTYADISKAKKLLQYNPSTGIEEGIMHFMKWYKEKKK